MVVIDISFKNGLIVSLNAEGHAGNAKPGLNLICAAVSVLLRTFISLIEVQKKIIYFFHAEKEGTFSFKLLELPDEYAGWYAGVSDFVYKGLKDLAGENKEEVSIKAVMKAEG